MRTQAYLIPLTAFAAAFPEFTKFYGAKDCLKAGGASIRMRTFLLARARKSIESAGHIRI
jgi:hypothetical protein